MASSSGRPTDLLLNIKLQNYSQNDWGTVYVSILILRDAIKSQSFEYDFPSFPIENRNPSIGVVLYENDCFFNSKQFKSELDTKRRVVSASLTDKSLLDNVEFTIRPEVNDCKLIMIKT